MREITCQYCGKKITMDADGAAVAHCPHCLKEFGVPAATDSSPVTQEQNILPYGRPGPRVRAGPFMIGFFGTLAFTVVAFIVLFVIGTNFFEVLPGSSSGEGLGIICSIFIAGVYVAIGLMARHLSREPRWAGIGRGVIVGICLSMIVMIPCAGALISMTNWR